MECESKTLVSKVKVKSVFKGVPIASERFNSKIQIIVVRHTELEPKQTALVSFSPPPISFEM